MPTAPISTRRWKLPRRALRSGARWPAQAALAQKMGATVFDPEPRDALIEALTALLFGLAAAPLGGVWYVRNLLLGGGEFIINGAERVVVSQLHRSPGVDFISEMEGLDKRLHSCRIIPERGSWIELNVTKKDVLVVRIDQSGKFAASTLLRAMDPKYGTHAELIRCFYQTETVKVVDGRSVGKIENKIAVTDVVYPASSDRAGEIMVESGQKITKNVAELICTSGVTSIEVMEDVKDPIIFNTLQEDNTQSHEEALLKIYQRLRPGNPPQLEKARALFFEKFFDTNRYRLGRVGRFRINRKLGLNVSEEEMTLRAEDLIASVRYLGTQVAREHPVVRTWGVGSPAEIPLDSLITERGHYNPRAQMRLAARYPVIEGYKGRVGYGYHVIIEDPLQFNQFIATASYSPARGLPDDESFHLDLVYKTLNWKFRYWHNDADFYDLFGPTERARAGDAVSIGYHNSWIYDPPRQLDFGWEIAHYRGLDTLPAAQAVQTQFDVLTSFPTGRASPDTTKYYGNINPPCRADYLCSCWNLNCNRFCRPTCKSSASCG